MQQRHDALWHGITPEVPDNILTTSKAHGERYNVLGINKSEPIQGISLAQKHQAIPCPICLQHHFIRKGMWHTKLGKTTKSLPRHDNPVCCKWKGRAIALYDVNDKAVDMQGIFEELVICCKKLGEISHEQDFFTHDRDLGLLVIDIQGKVCDLLYGAVSGSF